MNSAPSNLSQLIELAREPSSARRRELLRRMTDLFTGAPDQHSPEETAQIGDILSILAREMEMEVRQTLATRLSDLPNAPRNLILELANDEIAVARPVLVNSLVLEEEDLVALVRMMSQEHLKAIASRARVSPRLSSELVALGDDTVLAQLAGNQGAEIPRPALDTIAGRAEQADIIQMPLVMRPGLPPDLLNTMFFAVSSSLKQVILTRMREVDPAVVEEAIGETERRLKRRAAIVETDRIGAARVMHELKRLGTLTESVMVTLAKQKRHAELAAVFARLTALSHATAQRILSDPCPESLAVVARACRFDRQTFITLALERTGTSMPMTEAYRLVALYDRVPADGAQRLMRFWRACANTDDIAA